MNKKVEITENKWKSQGNYIGLENSAIRITHVDGSISNEEDETNAKLIVHTVNNHEPMLQALKRVDKYFIDLQNKFMLTSIEERVWAEVSKAIHEAEIF